MTLAADLLAELHERGIELRVERGRLLYRSRDAMSPELLARLTARKAELLEALRRTCPGGSDAAKPVDLAAGTLLAERQEPVAWRLYSRLLDRQLWLARDPGTAAELAAEFPGMAVLTIAEVSQLAGKPPELLRAVLDTKAAFPEARLQC